MNWNHKFRSKLSITTKHSSNNHGEQQKSATFCQILKYAHGADYLWLAIGLLTSLITSTVTPAVNILYSEAANLFIDFDYWYRSNDPINMTSTVVIEQKRSEFLRTNWQIFWMFTIICLTSFLSSFGTLYSFQIFSLRLTRTVKRLYFAAILRQEIAWFDQCNPGQFAARVAIDFKKFQNVFNENMAILLYNVFTAISLLLMSLIYGWKLFLAILSIAPLMGINSLVCMKFLQHYTRKEMNACSMASSVAEEAISAIRTVFAFSGQRKEAQRYETQLKSSMIYGCKRNFFTAVGVAMNLTLIYLALGFGIWYGTILINDPHEQYTIARVLIVFWGVASAGIRLNNTAPFNEAIETGKVAAKAIFEVIERKPLIDSSQKFIGQCSDNYQANIEFQDVHFAYPSRMDVKVLRGLNLRINSGERIALVGPSGCGKSTTIQLIQRFYDVDRGKVLLDGQDIRYLNVGWLRQQLGVVGQEPVLFDASIEENIRLGMPFNQMDRITFADVERAAKEANAHDFIKKLPLGYQTHVGDRGTQLSGGQKQRIAIARALIGKPKILLLDEATSALDLASEQTVQLALDRASRNCTTVIIAHRLSTIINADRIIYIDQGEVVEQGTHDALMAQRGRYYDLVQAQQVLEQSIHQLDHQHPEIMLDEPRKRSRAATMHSDQGDYLENQSNGVATNVANNNNNNAEEQERLKKVSNQRLLALIWHDKFYCIVAIISASIYGLSSSLYALIFGEFVDVFAQSQDPDYRTRNTLIQSFYCVLLASSNLIFGTLQISLFGIVGEKLTKRLRMMAYEAILRQDVSFFDEKANSAGALCSRLSSDAAHVQGATGLRVSMICQAASMIIFTILIGTVVNWRLLLASIMLMPMVAFGSLMMSTTFSNQAKDDSEAEERSSKILIEATNAIRTVVSLHKEQYFYAILEQNLDQHYRISKRTCLFKSIILGISLTCMYLAYTISFWYGGYLICYGLLKSGDFFKIVESSVLGAYMVGQSAVFSQDVTKAKMASMNIFRLIDRTTTTTTTTTKCSTDNEFLDQQRSHDLNLRSKGNVSFESVHFSYPSRPEAKVLNGLSFRANQGQTVALVGTSGCGKSTSLQLLERFYDCVDGMILLDGANIARVPVEWLRAQMSLVQQEPILFSYSIKENIAYGDNTRSVPFCDIQQAAMMANVHDFISELPEGYDTPVGAKGVCQLSGGQKQRIAIARALLRNPPILLLDEATSALDTESEQIVQRALDKASRNRTCLVIAHRLKTIINADRIVVMDKGRKVEEGTHQELLSRREHYWRLYNKAISPKPPLQPKPKPTIKSSSSSSSNQCPVITITEPK